VAAIGLGFSFAGISSEMNALQTIATEYASLGLSVIAALPRSKQPAMKWTAFQWEPPTLEEVEAIFSSDEDLNVAVICGAASQNLAVFDAETKTSFDELVNLFVDAGLEEKWFVETPRGGHAHIRLPAPVKSLKYGSVEVRSQGQYVLVPPSIHPTGSSYKFLQRSRRIAQAKTLAQLNWIDLEPVLGKPQKTLPRKALHLLNGRGNYKSRSETEQALITILVNAGYVFDEIWPFFARIKGRGSSGRWNRLIQLELPPGSNVAISQRESGAHMNPHPGSLHVTR
jgi:hypothetical protein